jgi:hypothetical protein
VALDKLRTGSLIYDSIRWNRYYGDTTMCHYPRLKAYCP